MTAEGQMVTSIWRPDPPGVARVGHCAGKAPLSHLVPSTPPSRVTSCGKAFLLLPPPAVHCRCPRSVPAGTWVNLEDNALCPLAVRLPVGPPPQTVRFWKARFALSACSHNTQSRFTCRPTRTQTSRLSVNQPQSFFEGREGGLRPC